MDDCRSSLNAFHSELQVAGETRNKSEAVSLDTENSRTAEGAGVPSIEDRKNFMHKFVDPSLGYAVQF